MSPEPKPRSMAAVTITVNRMGATAQWPLPNLAKCWNIRVSPGTFPSSEGEVTIRGVRTISRKGHSSDSKTEPWNPQRPYARPSVPGGRYGPICVATYRAWQNRNDHAPALIRAGVTPMPKVAKFLVG
jgi:hypothetical protein